MADTIGTISVNPVQGMPQEEWNRFCAMVAEGRSNPEMIEALGRPERTIAKKAVEIRKALGIVSRFGRTTEYTASDDETIIQMYADGRMFTEIAERLGRSDSGVGSRLKVLRAKFPNDERLAPRAPVASKPKKRISTLRHRPKFGSVATAYDPQARMEAKAKAEQRFTVAFFDRTPKPHMAGVPLEMLNARSCRYACNEADVKAGEEHLFCGARSVDGRRYCAEHLKICEVKYVRGMAL